MSTSLNQIVAKRVSDRLTKTHAVFVEAFDFGNALGVAIEAFILGGRQIGRHAVRVKIIDYDLTKAADEAAEALNGMARSDRFG